MNIAEFEIKLQAKEKLILPPYKGSVIRGAFGSSFRKVCCPFPAKDCKECLLKSKCVYSYVFETPRPEGAEVMRKYENVPHPFIIEPPLATDTEYKTDDLLSFNLILLGKAVDFFPYFIYSFEYMAERGLGKGRGKLELLSIYQGKDIIYDGNSKTIKSDVKKHELKAAKTQKPVKNLSINFLTPLRVKYQGEITQNLDFHIIIRNLIRRIGLLSYFHSDKPFEIDFRSLIDKATKVKTKSARFDFLDWSRYSSRQDKMIKMDGLVGEATYQGNLTQFIPYLKIGEKVHLGKGTAFGLGKYRMEVIG